MRKILVLIVLFLLGCSYGPADKFDKEAYFVAKKHVETVIVSEVHFPKEATVLYLNKNKWYVSGDIDTVGRYGTVTVKFRSVFVYQSGNPKDVRNWKKSYMFLE